MSFSKNSIIILVFFTNYLLLSIHGNRELFPNGVQLGYRWKAITHVGTVLPSEHITKYSFDAYFVVQSNQNYTTFQIKEFQTTEKQQYFPWIALPFRCTYKDGEIQKIETEYDDVSGSLNIKRALAALFQLKLESFSQAAFTTQETGIFGKCSAQYIINKDNNETNVEKIINFSACNGKLGQQWSNTPPFTCPSNYQDGSISHSIRHYSLDDKDIINSINVIGTIEFQPFQALAEAHRIFVNQSIFLEGISSSTDITTLVNKLEVTIEYDFNHYEDPTLGFKPSNKTQLLSEIHGALEQLTESLSWELGTSDLDNQTSFRALELMWWLDVPDWNMLYDTIKIGTSYSQETVQHIFWDLLPQVGSASSVEFIRELVKTQKATSFLATGLLMMFPYNVRYPNEKLLQESEMLLNLDKVIRDAEIMKVAILSFSTLIQKTCSNNMCSTDIQNKYIKLFLDRFHESSNYGDQMMYIEALNNMKINNILDFLTPIINDNNRSRHIRLIAIWASKYTVTIHPEKVAEVFWPIFTNHSEPLEIRTSSLDMLMMSQPSISRFLTLFWFMQSEPNQNMYNYYYTTINSLVNSKYPCYSKYSKAISQIARFVRQKWHNWATGNYILDYEDLVRGYGGIVQTILIANKHTGFPSVLRITAEQHSFGTSSEFEIHIKAEGFTTNIKKEIFNSFVNPSFEVVNVSKILEVLENAKLKIRNDEELHFEAIIKFNQQTIFCHYMNRTSFNSFFNTMKRISSLYFQFSFNYQRLSFPLRFQRTMFTDYGTPVLLQFRTASLLSLRGSIKQAESGKSRDAELDFRYSMDTVTSLKTFNPLSNIWHGADRFRCIHARIPFSTEIVTQFFRSYVKASAHRYKNFVDGSKLGVVWHSATKLFPMKESLTQNSKNELLSDDWAFESRDLGAKIATAVFDCQDNGTFSNSLMIIKEAFQISNKNYRSIPGGAAFLSIYSLSNYFTFIPPEDSCGLILSISPLQVVPVYVQEGNTVHITMNHYEQVLWDLSIHYTRLADGNQELSFKLSHSNRERDITITNGYWRLLQFEGSFVLPSRKSGALHPPPPMHGQATVSWGYHSSSTTMTLAIKPEHAHEKWPEQCIADSPTCLQIASDISTSQIISLKFLNLPNWMIITMHSLFPDFVHDEGNLTTAKFTFPTKLPWTTRGICAVNTKTVLTLDNSTTHNFDLNQDCYTIALGDCSNATRFVIGIKINPITSLLDIHLISQNTIISMIHDGSKVRVHVNEIEIEVMETTIQFPPKSKNDSFIYRVKRWDKEMTDLEIHPGVTIQHYGQTVLMLVESKLRGHTCGLCGNFNGESSDEIYNLTTNCVRF